MVQQMPQAHCAVHPGGTGNGSKAQCCRGKTPEQALFAAAVLCAAAHQLIAGQGGRGASQELGQKAQQLGFGAVLLSQSEQLRGKKQAGQQISGGKGRPLLKPLPGKHQQRPGGAQAQNAANQIEQSALQQGQTADHNAAGGSQLTQNGEDANREIGLTGAVFAAITGHQVNNNNRGSHHQQIPDPTRVGSGV